MPAPSPARGRSSPSLTIQLFAFVVLPLMGLLIVVAVGSLSLHAQAMRDLVSERNARAAQAAAAAIREQLAHRVASLRGLALYSAALGDGAQALAGHEFLLEDFEGGLAVFTLDGHPLAEWPGSLSWTAGFGRALPSPTSALAEPWFSGTHHTSAAGERLVVVGVAHAGRVAAGAFAPAGLAREILGGTFTANPQVFAALLSDTGDILYQVGQPSGAEADLARHPGVTEALRGESGRGYLIAGGEEHVLAYVAIPPVGWALLLEESWEAVDNPMLSQTQAAPLILVPALISALIALAFGLRQIIQPLRALEHQASEVGWGRFDALSAPVGGIAEIQRLQAELARMAEKVKSAQQNLRGYLGAITAGQEDERRRLARELHDGTIQDLIALDQRAQLAQRALPDGPEPMRARLAEVRQMTADIMEEVRRVIRALRPIYLEDLGLLPALEMLVQDAQTAAGGSARFLIEGQARRLSPAQEIAIYRIVQEALNNAARYAQAATLQVRLAFLANALQVRVEDDGQGFAAPERVSDLVALGHYGLMGMQERAELIGARLRIRSTPGAGTALELELPLPPPER